MPTSQTSNENSRENARQAVNAARNAGDVASHRDRIVSEEAAEVGQHAANAGAEIGRTTTETARQVNESTVNMATEVVQRSIDGFARTLGLTGERARESTEQASHNLLVIVDTTTVLARGAQDISREWVSGAQDRLRRNLDGFGELARCRTPQDFCAVQSSLVRDYVQGLLNSSQRISEISAGIAREATQEITAQAYRTAREVERAA